MHEAEPTTTSRELCEENGALRTENEAEADCKQGGQTQSEKSPPRAWTGRTADRRGIKRKKKVLCQICLVECIGYGGCL